MLEVVLYLRQLHIQSWCGVVRGRGWRRCMSALQLVAPTDQCTVDGTFNSSANSVFGHFTAGRDAAIEFDIYRP